MRARSFGIMGITAASSLAAFFRGIGDTRTPLIATLIANLANLFLDLGLVYGWYGMPRLGVVGAGLATSISEWIYFGAVAFMFLRPAITNRFNTRFHAPSLGEIKRLWRTGVPIGGQWTIEMLAFAVFTTFVARLGDAPMAASHAFIQLLSLSFMQAVGISIATTTLVGRYIGAGQLEYVSRSLRSSMLLGSLLAAIIAALFMLVPELLLGLFSKDPDVLRYGRPLLMVGALYQFFDAIAIVSDGALRGAGDTPSDGGSPVPGWAGWLRSSYSPGFSFCGFALERGAGYRFSCAGRVPNMNEVSSRCVEHAKCRCRRGFGVILIFLGLFCHVKIVLIQCRRTMLIADVATFLKMKMETP